MNFSSINNNFPNNYCPFDKIDPIDGNDYTEIKRNNFNLYQEPKNSDYGGADYALQGIQCSNDLSKLFFSKKNMNRIQKKLKEEVKNRTRGKYLLTVDQNETSLLF